MTSDIVESDIGQLNDWSSYFDDIERHIDMLQDEADILDDCVHLDELKDRITFLKSLEDNIKWIDNDITSAPDAWKSLEVYTTSEAIKQYKEWTN